MNSFQNYLDGITNIGRLHIIPCANRSTSWFSDSSVSTTWETANLSAYAPLGVKALLCYTFVNLNGSTYDALWWMRAYGETVSDYQKQAVMYTKHDWDYYYHTGLMIMECDEQARWQYRAYDNSSWDPDVLYWNVRGYFK